VTFIDTIAESSLNELQCTVTMSMRAFSCALTFVGCVKGKNRVSPSDIHSMQVRGKGWKKDVARAAFFSQAHGCAVAADAMLGTHRPKIIEGPLPAGLDPAIMWRVAKYKL
jgi:hypothetical protein